MVINKYLILLFFVGCSAFLKAQNINYISSDQQQILLNKFVKEYTVENDSSGLNTAKIIIQSLRIQGYLESSIDSVTQIGPTNNIYLYLGKPYQWISLNTKGVSEYALKKVAYNPSFFNSKPLNIQQLSQLQNNLVRHFENNGYPFAQVFLDSIYFKDGVSAKLVAEPNQLIKIDSISINSEEPLPTTYLHNYLGIHEGDLYNEKQIREIPTRLKEIPFVNQVQPTTTAFTNEETILNISVSKQKASSFNGIVGFLPDDVTGNILITGDVKLVLQNGLGSGELIDLNWRRLETNTQDLRVKVNYPFIGNTPLGGNANLKLYRKDTTFAEQAVKVGLQYALSRGNFFSVFLDNYNSNLISTQQYEGVSSLPQNADMRKRSFGIGLQAFKLNYKFNPRSGYQFDLNFSSGNKRIIQNPNLDATLYDSIQTNTTQFFLQFFGQYFIPIFDRSTIMIGGNGGWLINDQLFQNELFRIGGLKTLRGFDEESILASAYTILSAEYRILLEENSYFFLFADGAFWESKLPENYNRDTPFGFGAGISFETKAGIFTLNYAIGRQRNNPIDLRTNKIHFGFVSLF